MNKYLSTHTIEHKKNTTYVVQAQQCGGGKPINGIPPPPSDNWIYNDRQFRVRVIMFNASYVSVISCQSVSLVKEAEVPGDNHQPAASH